MTDLKSTDLNIKVLGSKLNNGNFVIKGIPTEVWDAFREEAEILMPDKGEYAWSEVFTSVILSLVKAKERVLLMNEIPDFVYESAENVCRQADSSLQELIKDILEASATNNFYLGVVKRVEPDVEVATVIFTGVPLQTIKMFDHVANFYAQTQNLKNFGAIDFLVRLFAQNSSNLHFATATPDALKDSHTFVISNVPNDSYNYWQNLADQFKMSYKEASKQEIKASAVTMLATLLLNSGNEQVTSKFTITQNPTNTTTPEIKL